LNHGVPPEGLFYTNNGLVPLEGLRQTSGS